MGHEAENRYHVQGKMNGRGRKWKNYTFSNDRNEALHLKELNESFVKDSGVGWKWRVWDTYNDNEVAGRHYDFNDILNMRETEEPGAKVELELKEGDTAYQPGTTKHVFHGPMTVTYWIHASGWDYQTEVEA